MTRVVVLLGLLAACRKGSATGAEPASDSSAGIQGNVPSARAAAATIAARCHRSGKGVSLDDGGGLGNLEIGDGITYPGGYALGLIHRTQVGSVVPSIALLGRDLGDVRVVDLGPTLGDSPPPRLAWCGKDLLAAAFRSPAGGVLTGRGPPRPNRDLGLYVVERRLPPKLTMSISQHRDDSLAFDLACSGGAGLAVWDETMAGPPGTAARGVVRAVPFEVGQPSKGVRDLSPPDSDAELPRVMSNGAGFFVLWLARRPEQNSASDGSAAKLPGLDRELGAATDIEAPGEERAYGYIEMLVVNEAGNAIGPVRRLTPISGHVSAYDVELAGGGGAFDASKPSIVVVARDDAESVEGTGGALLKLRAWADGAEAPEALPIDGLGRGAPIFVDGTGPLAPWLAWVGPHERLHMLPLDRAGGVVAQASIEDGFDEARPLLFLAADGRVLVSAPGDQTAQLQVFDCQR